MSTATPPGLFSPDTSFFRVLADATHSLMALWRVSAMYRLPRVSSATPEGLLRPVEINVLSVFVAELHFLMELSPVSAIYTLPKRSTATPCGRLIPVETSVEYWLT